jgi:ankyrin repeat protein
MQESNRTAVMAAAGSGSARVIRALLNAANNVDEVMRPTKVHALHEAAKNGHLDAIKVNCQNYPCVW